MVPQEINCILAGTTGNQNPKFEITDRKLYILVVALSTQDNIKLFKQPESGFKIIINWNKYLSKTTGAKQIFWFFNWYKFWGSKYTFLVSSFKDEGGWESYGQYYLPTVKIKDYNIMIDGRNFLNKPIKNDLKTHDSIRKIVQLVKFLIAQLDVY